MEQHSVYIMKALLSLIAAASVLGAVVPLSAQAIPPVLPMGVQPCPGERRIVSYLTNGTPVWAVYQAIGYDAMGYPIYQWVTLPTSSYVRPYCGGHVYGGYRYPSYSYRAPAYVTPHFGGHVSPPMHHGGGVHIGHSGGGHHGGGHHR